MGYSAQSIGEWVAWTPVWSGFSAVPTVTFSRYTLNGKMCTCYLRGSAGTSNATSLTLTLPFAAANTGIQWGHAICTDNSSNQTTPGLLATIVNSNILNCYKTSALGAWTGSGTKFIQWASFTYEIA